MLIVGNSHVSVFKHGVRIVAAPEEPVQVRWVGALGIEQFQRAHPSAQRVRQLFADEPGWKCLMMGNHDVLDMAVLSQFHPESQVLERFLAYYREVFADLARGGQFAWMVGLQQTANVGVAGMSERQIQELSQRFNASLSAWCRANGIPVIDPLASVLGSDGMPADDWLMADRLHLKPEAASFYFEAMRRELHIEVASLPATELAFEPITEEESFCSLLITELGLAKPAVKRETFHREVTSFISEKLAERGIDLEVGANTDFVTTSLLDSLDLVETYTFAMNYLGLDLDFDVNLRELNTVRKLGDWIFARANLRESAEEVATPSDFYLSLRGDVTEQGEREAILAADRRIAALGADFRRESQNLIDVVVGGQCRYGMVLFWQALCAYHAGDHDDARNLLALATSPGISFPLSDARAEVYHDLWLLDLLVPDRRSRNVLLAESEPERVRAVVDAYLDAYSETDDIALHLLTGENGAWWVTWIMDVIEQAGRHPEHVPDISILGRDARSDLPASVFRVFDLVVGPLEVVELARSAGCSVIAEATPERLQRAFVSALSNLGKARSASSPS